MILVNINKNNNEFKKLEKWLESKKINKENLFISPGWIDSHVHLYKKSKYHYYEKKYKRLNGVVAAIEAGSTGVNTIEDAIKIKYPLKVFYLLNLSSDGLLRIDELNNPKFDLEKLLFYKNNKNILGYKMRYSSQATSFDQKSVVEILENVKKLKLPIMYHVGNEPPKFNILKNYIKKKDIITHSFHNKNNRIVQYLKTKPKCKFDVGFGNESFSFDRFKQLSKSGFDVDTISSDIHNYSIKNKNCQISKIMSIFLSCDYNLESIIKKVTSNPIKIFKIRDKVIINSFTLFKINKCAKICIDTSGKNFVLKKEIIPIGKFVGGEGTLYEKSNKSKW